MNPSPETKLLAVYEALNSARREVYVGGTDLLMEQLVARTHSSPPAAIGHWRKDDGLLFRFLAYSVPPERAKRMIAQYAADESLKGWAVLREPA